jgi:predicted outer membrane repeat protein
MLLACAGCTTAFGDVIYVNHAATGANTGTSWADAYTDLQTAIAAAGSADEIWVARGVYRPAPPPTAPGQNRTASFALKTGVSIYGGFAGTETQRDQRDWAANVTVLSGDLLGDDGPDWSNRSDNCYHVVTAVQLGHCRLDGFTITGGHADGEALGATPESNDQGSGANVYDAAPHFENLIFEGNYASNHGAVNDHGDSTLVACTFRRNYAGVLGAGLYMHFTSATRAIQCVFTANETPADGGGAYSRSYAGAMVEDSIFSLNFANNGAGMYLSEGGSTTILRSLFTQNTAMLGGGGVYSKDAATVVRDCVFIANDAGLEVLTGAAGGGGSGGGGFWASGGSPLVEDCVFVNNSATFGGGAYFNEGSTGTVRSCWFEDNLANEAGGLYSLFSPVRVLECVFTRNRATGGQFPVGGGMSVYYANTFTQNCLFDSNSAGLGGGGLYVEGESPLTVGCIFARNFTEWLDQGWGGGVLNSFNTEAKLVSCLIVGNNAQRGGGVANAVISSPTIINSTIVGNHSRASDSPGGGIHTLALTPANVQNSLVWGNTPEQISGPNTVAFSSVQGGFEGEGNIEVDPLFMRLPHPGADGDWRTDDDDLGDLRLMPGSPVIDAGNTELVPAEATVDAAGAARLVGPKVDMGAYEAQLRTCTPDYDGDGDVATDADIEAFFACLAGNCCPACAPDFDGDGDVATDADIESFFRVLAGGAC